MTYRNLCRNVDRILSRDVSAAVARRIGARLGGYDREELWEDALSTDGFCVFACQDFDVAYSLPGPFPELEVVGATFHTKPLIRYLQGSSGAYYLLALNIRRVALYEAMGDSIREIPLRGVPLSLDGEEASVPPRGGSTGGPGRATRKPAKPGRGGDAGAKSSEPEHAREHFRTEIQPKTELEKFFRTVARELWKNHLRASTRSLILAAPAQHQAIFRRVSQIPTLLETGVVGDPAKLTVDELRAEATRALGPAIEGRIARAGEEFGLAKSRGQGTDDLGEIARLAAAGRVGLLLVESGRRIWGVFNPDTGELLPGDQIKNAYDVDLLDELAELVLVRGGEVFVVRPDTMPTGTGIAAILRY